MSRELHAPAVLLQERTPDTHWIEGCGLSQSRCDSGDEEKNIFPMSGIELWSVHPEEAEYETKLHEANTTFYVRYLFYFSTLNTF